MNILHVMYDQSRVKYGRVLTTSNAKEEGDVQKCVASNDDLVKLSVDGKDGNREGGTEIREAIAQRLYRVYKRQTLEDLLKHVYLVRTPVFTEKRI